MNTLAQSVCLFWVLFSFISAILIACGGGSGGGNSDDVKQWTHPTDLNDNISPAGWSAILPRVAMSNNGDAIVVWQQGGGNYHETFKSEYRVGSWIHPESLNDSINIIGGSTYLSRVAMDDNGNAVIAWYQSDGTNLQVFKSEYLNDSWTHPLSLDDNISLDGTDAYYSRVAMDAKGDALIVWYQSGGIIGTQIYKSEFRSGLWVHPIDFNDHVNPLLTAINPAVAMDDNGNAIIVWLGSDGLNAQIFKSEYRNGNWTPPAGLNDNISPNGTHAT